MMTRVANIYHLPLDWKDDPKYVYIGRAGRGLDGTFGNPFRLGPDERRGVTLTRYGQWLSERLEDDPEFRDKVVALHGKVLVCFCKPQACHGDYLAAAADELEAQRCAKEADVSR